ncbi:hypothetical protein DICVIV_09240 [Dictyocaulus viviparus]|uniref:LRRCT domain-containing protein n=1 Tax=Dictyocaulus viviparus TaxID=29172 RepID=A0A0D8XQW6_DICVI|nr:hypothetical protein DICVIV_09240 [Dictyocaulus viviparus]
MNSQIQKIRQDVSNWLKDINYNQLESLSKEVFMNSFLPQPNDRRVIYCCVNFEIPFDKPHKFRNTNDLTRIDALGNPWYCNSELLWLRQLFRDNLDIDIEKPGCQAICTSSPSGCPAQGTPLRAVDFCLENEEPQPYTGQALALVGWIILAIIMTIFLISICLLAMVRYGMSHRRKKQKDQEFEDDARMMSSAASLYGSGGGGVSAIDRPYSTLPPLNLDLPPAHTLDDRPSNYFY